MGEPESELYRGARLTKALDWRRTSRPDLTVTEMTFLDRSAAVRDAEHDAADEQQRTAARSRRRTRMLVTGVAGLLVAALVAGLLALNQQWRREDADLAAAAAEASRVDNAARSATVIDQAFLLALEANRLHDSPESRAAVAELLSTHPALIRSMVLPTAVHGLAVSPDGKVLAGGRGR